MKSFNKVLGTIKKRPTFGSSAPPPDSSEDPATTTIDPSTETPEATATRCVKGFCNSGGDHSGNDVTYLPYIVDAAESSPAAAAESARLIRKFLNRDYWTKPSYQYNAIMLVRILSDNPGATFTRNLDKKFVDTTKELLRSGRDPSVRQMLMETLDSFENTKGYDENLRLVIDMWKKEKEKAYKAYGGRPAPGPRTLTAPPFDPHQQSYFSRSHTNMRLPNPVELANRLEEARTSAKLLEQVVACTPPSDVLSNDLIKEFADRCLSASRSIQGYMVANNPPPDNDTMESLIDSNEQLQHALNQHQRALLNAKKQLGLGERSSHDSSGVPRHSAAHDQQHQQGWGSGGGGGLWQQPSSASSSQRNVSSGAAAPPLPSRNPIGGNGKGKASDHTNNHSAWERERDQPTVAGPSRSGTGTPQRHHDEDHLDDPFRDPQPEPSGSTYRPSGGAGDNGASKYAYEPFHPGFSGSDSGAAAAAAAAAAGGKDDTSRLPRQRDPITPVSDDGLYDNDDAYRATPGKKSEAVYRY